MKDEDLKMLKETYENMYEAYKEDIPYEDWVALEKKDARGKLKTIITQLEKIKEIGNKIGPIQISQWTNPPNNKKGTGIANIRFLRENIYFLLEEIKKFFTNDEEMNFLYHMTNIPYNLYEQDFHDIDEIMEIISKKNKELSI